MFRTAMNSIYRNAFWIVGLLAASGCGQPAAALDLKQTAAEIWTSADIAEDAEFSKLVAHDERGNRAPVTPLDMRKVALDWPGTILLRDNPERISLFCRDGYLGFSWAESITTGDEYDAAKTRAISLVNGLGYQKLEKPNESELFKLTKQHHWSTTPEIYVRKIGYVEMLVIFESLPVTGGEHYSAGVTFSWYAVRKYTGPAPTFTEGLALLPASARVKYVSEALYAKLGPESIAFLASGIQGMNVAFAKDVSDVLAKALEAEGFEFWEEYEPLPDGRIQRAWFRNKDVTYASIITAKDSSQTELQCQIPQNQGAPVNKPSRPRNPILKIPPSKRPAVTLDQLTFDDERLKKLAEDFQAVAEKTAGQDWIVDRYKDSRFSPDPSFGGSWRTSDHKGYGIPMSALPYQGLGVALSGNWVGGVDRIQSLEFRGSWVPKTGWAACVGIDIMKQTGMHPVFQFARVMQVDKNVDRVQFDDFSPSTIDITQPHVSAKTTEETYFVYSYSIQDETDKTERSTRKLRAIFGPPEGFRDEMLATYAALRSRAREEIPQLTHVGVEDMTNVRSNNPPQSMPATTRKPKDATLKSLLDQVESQIDVQENAVRANFQEIQASVQRALPIGPLIEPLLEPAPANAEKK